MSIPKFIKITASFALAAGLVGAGTGAGWLLANQSNQRARNTYPLLDSSVSDPNIQQEIINFDPLRQNLKKYLSSVGLSHSLYFEYLPNGVNIRDGDDNVSQGASLMKTPLVMDLYKLSEQAKISLDTPNAVEPVDINNDSQYGNPTRLKPGDTITLRQAAQITLRYSDNTTLNIIKDRILPLIAGTSDSFRSLDLNYTISGNVADQQVSISARAYGSILKCLYYACFNSPKDSSEIIGYLMGSSEPNRLAAGIGPGIRIAHKVGSGGSPAQSDCGIVYYPSRPYMVCLMFFNITGTTNTDPYFKHVSQMIFDYIAAAGPSNKIK